MPNSDQYARSVGVWSHKSGSHRETTPAHGSGTSHVTTHADTLIKGQELIWKGDIYRDQGEFDNAAKNYKLAAQFCPNEAAEKLKLIPLYCTTSEGNDQSRKPTSTGPHFPRNDESHKPTSTGQFFPRNDRSHPLLLMSQATDMPKGSVCAFDDTKDTNAIVVSFIEADAGTKIILRSRIYDIIAQFKDNLATLETA
ncbi:hypothetical protein BGX26_012248 [Mortierella sp. AD094]|nr:hypothetical protein BGX26_012248 [Mortierella sp. AD094]